MATMRAALAVCGAVGLGFGTLVALPPASAVIPGVYISEVESSGGVPGDWIELSNGSDETIDLSGYVLKDDDDTHEYIIEAGTEIAPGEYLVFDELLANGEGDFDFGLGGNDTVRLYDHTGTLIDTFSWDGMGHAEITYIRAEDGSVVPSGESTKGAPNVPASPAPEPVTSDIVVNEIVYDDPVGHGHADSIELFNVGTEAVDLTGWSIHDDKERPGEGDLSGTLEPGEYLVLVNDVDFMFGLGKGDSVRLMNAEGEFVDQYAYEATAPLGDWSRCPDGTGDFAHGGEVTLGGPNNCEQPTPEPVDGNIVINEIDSAPADFVEFYNPGETDLDISGYEVRDNSDDHRWKFPTGTTITPGQFLVVEADSAGQVWNDQTGAYEDGTFGASIGIGSGDSIHLYDEQGSLLDQHSWTEPANIDGAELAATFARCPDGTGPFALANATIGAPNDCVTPAVVINEIESNGDLTDWAEIKNNSDFAVDISGWTLMDNDPIGHANDVTPLPEGTILEPGAYFVFDGAEHFTFGLGKEDVVTIRDANGVTVAEEGWTDHAAGVYARCPDGTGDFIDVQASTKGSMNACGNPVILNEIESSDAADGPDWIELANPLDEDLDISGLTISDNKDDNVYTIADGTTVPARGYLVIDDLGFGLGGSDEVRIYDEDLLIQTYAWEAHAEQTYGRCPDMTGAFVDTSAPTPGERNDCPGIPNLIDWQGDPDVTVIDTTTMFLQDSSGLDYDDGILWAVDNGTGAFWKLNAAQDGSVSPAEGWETPKRARFIKDADNPAAAGPDAEGITIAGDGNLYLAIERDNSAKGVNFNAILQIDPNTAGPDVVASTEWDITDLLPNVSANMGIEAIEWVGFDEVNGRLWDTNTGAPFNSANYPGVVADGVFFIALEDNGHVYAFVLNPDGTAKLVSEIDSLIGGAMALNYDSLTGDLFIVSDDGYNGVIALATLNGTDSPDIVHMARPAGMENLNNEGFALSDQCVDGSRPAWFFEDGVKTGSLKSVQYDCKSAPVDPEEPGTEEPGEPTPQPKPEKGNLFYFVNDWTSTKEDVRLAYGRAGDEVLVGDWNGDGKDTLAVRRGTTFYVNNDLAGGNASIKFNYGRTGDRVIVGDWNGDGKDTFGVVRGTTFHLNNELKGGNATLKFNYGRTGDEVHTGDWNGDGEDTITLRRGNTFHVNNELKGGNANIKFNYGRAADQVFAGDYDGDGADSFAVRRGNTFYVSNKLTGGAADLALNYGRPSDTIHVGDWDGDGIDTPVVNRTV